MLTNLTQKQKKLKKEVKDFWINTALHSGDVINKKDAEEGIKYIYKKAGLKTPKVLFVSSPIGVQIARNLLNKKKFREVESEVRNEVVDEVEREVGGEVWGEVEREVWREVRNEVVDEVEREVGGEVWRGVCREVRNEVENEVWREVGGEVWREVGGEVWREVCNKVRNEVGNEVEREVWSEVENEVCREVGGEVESEVRNEVENEVRGEVLKNKKLKFYSFNYQNLTNIGWIAFYDYFLRVNIYSQKTKEIFERYKKYLLSGIFFSAIFSDYAILSRRPVYCKKDERGRLHSEATSAIKWRDGYEIYSLNGQIFEKSLWEKIVNNTIAIDEALKIDSADKRAIALKYIGGKRLERETGAIEVGKDQYGRIIELTKLKDNGGKNYRYYVAVDPSKGEEVYLRTHPDISSPTEAMTRAYKLFRFNLNYNPEKRT